MSEAAVVKKKKLTLRQKKRLAKYSLAATLGLVTVTGFMRNRTARRIHAIAGVAFIGLSIYHAAIYPKNQRS